VVSKGLISSDPSQLDAKEDVTEACEYGLVELFFGQAKDSEEK
jgi:hypothetical protein